MPYVVETWDRPDSLELRMRIRPQHIAFLEANTSRLLGAGAKLSDDGETMTGTIYIVDVETRGEAEAFVAQDPFTLNGLPERIVATRWRKAFFNFENNMHNL